MERFLQTNRIGIILLAMTLVGTAIVPLHSPRETRSSESFQQMMLPRLTVLADSVGEVELLVSTRSRNMLALQAHASRIETVVAEIDNWLASPSYDGRQADVVKRYLLGRDSVLLAIGDAQLALQSLDFASIPKLVPQFSVGADHLRGALELLEDTEPAGSS